MTTHHSCHSVSLCLFSLCILNASEMQIKEHIWSKQTDNLWVKNTRRGFVLHTQQSYKFYSNFYLPHKRGILGFRCLPFGAPRDSNKTALLWSCLGTTLDTKNNISDSFTQVNNFVPYLFFCIITFRRLWESFRQETKRDSLESMRTCEHGCSSPTGCERMAMEEGWQKGEEN